VIEKHCDGGRVVLLVGASNVVERNGGVGNDRRSQARVRCSVGSCFRW
jgi:hypothetical protein